MDASYELTYHRLEETHWWFQARRDMLFRLVARMGRPSALLEIGCSGGPFMRTLRQRGFTALTGIDISKRAISVCKSRGLTNVSVMDGACTAFADSAFDLIITSDVVEHISDDHAALAEWHRILRPGGTLLVFAPAFPALWSTHDIINHHYRRYSRSSLMAALKQAGFAVERCSYWNSSLFFPVSVARFLYHLLPQNGAPKSQLYKYSPALNDVLLRLLKGENRLLARCDFPVGVSVFAIARKQ